MKDAIRYTITIEATVQREEAAGREWKPVSNEPGAKMDYTPQITKVIEREIEVYKQEVDTLDVNAVIGVINGLPTTNGRE